MPISKAPANVAMSAMQAIPFNSMFGGPLKACIEAQAMAAQTSWEFIQNVGLNINPETGNKEAVNVSFSFNQGGRMVQLNVPLLTIVPIPYIAIHSVDINFKANISASSSSVKENSSSENIEAEGKAKAKLDLFLFSVEAELKANYSSKKDSKATEESKYSVESTIDVRNASKDISLSRDYRMFFENLNEDAKSYTELVTYHTKAMMNSFSGVLDEIVDGETGTLKKDAILERLMSAVNKKMLYDPDLSPFFETEGGSQQRIEIADCIRKALNTYVQIEIKDVDFKRTKSFPQLDVAVTADELAKMPEGSIHTFKLKFTPTTGSIVPSEIDDELDDFINI